MSLTSIIVKAKAKHTATVFWFHGLGDSGAGWSFLAEAFGKVFPHVKWIFPDAPVIPISMHIGHFTSAWFDLSGLNKESLEIEDEEGMFASLKSVGELIRDEIDSGTPANRIVIGGFSQGCALSLLTGLTSNYKFGGIVGCSGWLALSKKISEIASGANKATPILMCHGDRDQVVKYEYGKESAETLKSLGYNISFKTYPGLTHSANDQELADISEFLQKVIPPN